MAVLAKVSIDLTKIPKEKIYNGKKGKYVSLVVSINDDLDKFGNQGSVIIEQTKEERENKESKSYVGNARVLWTNGEIEKITPPDANQGAPSHNQQPQQQPQAAFDDDLPF